MSILLMKGASLTWFPIVNHGMLERIAFTDICVVLIAAAERPGCLDGSSVVASARLVFLVEATDFDANICRLVVISSKRNEEQHSYSVP
jgi:hypothetical protein